MHSLHAKVSTPAVYATGLPPSPQVVAVPAHFNQEQKRATHEAATAAGLAQVQLLQEPVAAAMAYGIHGGTDGDTVLVFDVGGGTFDIRRGCRQGSRSRRDLLSC
jgi:molecular chaperone DnaK (HSP70)